MSHWSVDDEPAEQATGENSPVETAPVANPPRQTAVERITEILERFFLEDSRLTAELLQQLSACTADDLVQMFGCSAPAAPPTPADVSTMDTSGLRGPVWMTPAERSQQQKPDSGNWRWDEQGRRIEKLRSSFPRRCEPQGGHRVRHG
jgi:hypothetical protein